MGNPVVHFEINARDPKRVQDFFARLFDWKIDASNPMNYGLVQTGAGRGIDGGIGAADDGGPGQVTFYVEVPDVQAHLDKVESLDGKTVVPVTEIPNMVTFAMFSDPEGHVIGLVKEEQPR